MTAKKIASGDSFPPHHPKIEMLMRPQAKPFAVEVRHPKKLIGRDKRRSRNGWLAEPAAAAMPQQDQQIVVDPPNVPLREAKDPVRILPDLTQQPDPTHTASDLSAKNGQARRRKKADVQPADAAEARSSTATAKPPASVAATNPRRMVIKHQAPGDPAQIVVPDAPDAATIIPVVRRDIGQIPIRRRRSRLVAVPRAERWRRRRLPSALW